MAFLQEIPPTMAFKDIQCRQAVSRDKPYKLAAGGGLFLLIKPNGTE